MKLKTLYLFFIPICAFFQSAQAQIKQSDNIVGLNFLIQSEVLQEEREIQVFFPDSYESSNKDYPVLYVLDGQRLFLHGVSLLQSFSHFKSTPEFIVVGITNKYPDRFTHFSSGSDEFLSFIENEVIPLIDEKFRTSEERILFGWEFGGGFVIKSMLNKPNLFDAYLASSAYPITNTTKRMDSLLTSNIKFNKLLYFSASTSESRLLDSATKLDSVLKIKAPASMKWVFKKLEGIEHRSTPYSAMEDGVKQYFKYYPELQFGTFEEFREAGGLPNVIEYYKRRSEKYGFSPELSEWTKFTILRNAIRANKYVDFEIYANKFISVDFIHGLRGNRPYEITDFYIKHKAYDKAINIFQILIEKDPESEKPLTELGDVYTLLNNKKEASKYYKKAKKLSKD